MDEPRPRSSLLVKVGTGWPRPMSRRKRYTRNLGRTLPSPQPVRTTVEWVRFENEHEPFGVFSYLSRAEHRLSPRRREKAEALRRWFNENLGSPDDATEE